MLTGHNVIFFREAAGRPKCPVDPYFIMPDKCRCVDFQVLKLQEAPEEVPNGEMPRHMTLFCDRYAFKLVRIVRIANYYS